MQAAQFSLPQHSCELERCLSIDVCRSATLSSEEHQLVHNKSYIKQKYDKYIHISLIRIANKSSFAILSWTTRQSNMRQTNTEREILVQIRDDFWCIFWF